jgi:hypothetical protein
MIYKWRDCRGYSVPAQTVGAELERIRDRNAGKLDPDMVVHYAKSSNHPLHPLFEWDDNVAAQAYRVDQARQVIRSIEVVVDEAPRAKPTRAFVSVVQDRSRHYTSVQVAMSDEQLRGQVVAQALVELEAWRKRYAELMELANVFAAIDQARAA